MREKAEYGQPIDEGYVIRPTVFLLHSRCLLNTPPRFLIRHGHTLRHVIPPDIAAASPSHDMSLAIVSQHTIFAIATNTHTLPQHYATQ